MESSREISPAVEEGLMLGVKKHTAADTLRNGLCKLLKGVGFKASEEFYSPNLGLLHLKEI